jgi:hypothetical protein
MDPLSVVNHLSNVLTVSEWQAFQLTEDYLWLMARIEGFKGAHMEKLVEAGKRRRQEAWGISLEMADSIVMQELKELGLDVPEEQRKVSVQALAEKLMMEQNLTPPTFTSWSDCVTCGRVPVPEKTEDSTHHCPWCQL